MISQHTCEQPKPFHIKERDHEVIMDQPSRSPFNWIRWSAILVVSLSSLLIVACGSSNDDDEADSGQVPTATTIAVATPTTVSGPTASATSVPEATTASPVEVPSLTIEPSSGPYGTDFAFQLSDLTPRGEYVVVTTLPDGTEDSARYTADSGGTYLIAAESGSNMSVGDPLLGWLSHPSEPAGEYVVELRDADGETVLAKDTFTVTEPTSADPTADADETPDPAVGGPSIRVSPESGPRETIFIFVASGLTPDQRYELAILYPGGGEDTFETMFDEESMQLIIVSGEYEGEPVGFWEVAPSDPLGEYTVELRAIDTGDVLFSTTFTVE